MNKPTKTRKSQPRPLADLVGACVADAFARQGFASVELVTHWDDIVGPEIAAHAEPMKLQWSRQVPEDAEPATLVLRVEGPAAIEIQHLAGVVVERVNRFFGWQAIGRIAIRQAPLMRRGQEAPPPAARCRRRRGGSPRVSDIADEPLRAALGRLGAAVKRP